MNSLYKYGAEIALRKLGMDARYMARITQGLQRLGHSEGHISKVLGGLVKREGSLIPAALHPPAGAMQAAGSAAAHAPVYLNASQLTQMPNEAIHSALGFQPKPSIPTVAARPTVMSKPPANLGATRVDRVRV